MATSPFLSEDDLHRFRTKPCRREKQKGCEFGRNRCQYSHNDYWPRRCPFYLTDRTALRYMPYTCPMIKLGDKDVIIHNTCDRGGHCPFSHSWEEVLYHPLFYKTSLCKGFHQGQCDSYYCPYVHGLAEQRVVNRTYTLPYTRGIILPDHPNVSVQTKPKRPMIQPPAPTGLMGAPTHVDPYPAVLNGCSDPFRLVGTSMPRLSDKASQVVAQNRASQKKQHEGLNGKGDNEAFVSDIHGRPEFQNERTARSFMGAEEDVKGHHLLSDSSYVQVKPVDRDQNNPHMPVDLFFSHSTSSTNSPPLSVSSTRSTAKSSPLTPLEPPCGNPISPRESIGLAGANPLAMTVPPFADKRNPSTGSIDQRAPLRGRSQEEVACTNLSRNVFSSCFPTAPSTIGSTPPSGNGCSTDHPSLIPFTTEGKEALDGNSLATLKESPTDPFNRSPLDEIRTSLFRALNLCETLDFNDPAFSRGEFEELTEFCYVTLGALMARRNGLSRSNTAVARMQSSGVGEKETTQELPSPLQAFGEEVRNSSEKDGWCCTRERLLETEWEPILKSSRGNADCGPGSVKTFAAGSLSGLGEFSQPQTAPAHMVVSADSGCRMGRLSIASSERAARATGAECADKVLSA